MRDGRDACYVGFGLSGAFCAFSARSGFSGPILSGAEAQLQLTAWARPLLPWLRDLQQTAGPLHVCPKQQPRAGGRRQPALELEAPSNTQDAVSQVGPKIPTSVGVHPRPCVRSGTQEGICSKSTRPAWANQQLSETLRPIKHKKAGV